MTAKKSEVHARPISGPDELGLFNQFPYVLNSEIAEDLDVGRRRPEWLWLALRDEEVVARLGWWSSSKADVPELLDVLDADDSCAGLDTVAVLSDLVRAASGAVVRNTSMPEYIRFVAPDWRNDPLSAKANADRMEALQRTGARLLVERLRLEWRPEAPAPVPSGALQFRPLLDDEEVIDLMTQTLAGTLDAHDRHDLEQHSPREVATRHFRDELARFESPRSWWRLASHRGEPVGFVMPAHNPRHAIIAYVGVLPQHRGNGYVDEILAEGMRVLEEQHVPIIRASTDVSNVPMALAFERAGWVNFERLINMIWETTALTGVVMHDTPSTAEETIDSDLPRRGDAG